MRQPRRAVRQGQDGSQDLRAPDLVGGNRLHTRGQPHDRLTDTQLAVLTAAAQRPDHALTISDRLRGAAVAKVVRPLLAKGLVEAVPHQPGMPLYQAAEDGAGQALVLVPPGFAALGLAPPVPLGATGAESAPKPARSPRGGTKQALLIDLLRRPEGATVTEAMAATGWLPHTVRGAIAGALKKRLGLTIATEKVENRGTVYRIVV